MSGSSVPARSSLSNFSVVPSQPCLTLRALVNSKWRTAEVVVRWRRNINRWMSADTSLRACPIHFHRYRHRPTSEFGDSIRYKPEVETLPQTGRTNNLATGTDIDAISVAIVYRCFRFFMHMPSSTRLPSQKF